MLIRTEQTPNPATRKFLPGQAVMEAGTRDFADADSADISPLAKAGIYTHAKLEVYDFPGKYDEEDKGKNHARFRLEAEQADQHGCNKNI